ncbi:type I-E CRISPR-associated protein Cse1/CasA [Thauera chlorobenzoica]|uniref:CRISPR-associated protein, Cse1 family n=1 Tax=Thauera chlorobenzoica TaxID=96773 RepID=A0A1H5Y5M1_9RHOO|nr:type I-E CRISPR-associated protein Cse1/CasA [Thauera chlorobenzoica]APR04650.1 CRISPR-associated protein, Cse1 family [Thauera chlorobenzoica]SEG18997.1 CRISPR-associated protein, Cse1 family [Thauera chlorobenzoica]
MSNMENRFNLIDEPWIPVAGVGRASLWQVFENPQYRTLGGNPVQRIALMKLLLAIGQAAATPADEHAWRALGAAGLARSCLAYLDRWHERFYLYGERPFLQMPAIRVAALQSYGAVLPEVSTGNTTVLNHGQVERRLDDGEKALLLVGLMAFALSGKKTDNSVVLTPGYAGKRNDKGKPSSSKPGPAVAHIGLLHSFLIGSSLQETLWLNLLTSRQVEQAMIFPQGIGTAPWERMPDGEDCPAAQALRQSLMGRLVPLCRFCLLAEDGLHYSEGLAHSGYKEGVCDPTVAVDHSGKEPKALWVDPDKRPWRELTSLLGFIEQGGSQGFQSLELHAGLDRARDATEAFAIWSGGLRVSSNAGEQYASGSDDFVESQVWLHSAMLGKLWFVQLKAEMDALGGLAKGLYGRVLAFFKEQKVDGSKLAAQASTLFWQLCERHFQQLVDACEPDEQGVEQRRQLRLTFAGYVQQAYDHFCPKETARQLDAWAKCRPNNSKYLRQEA